MTNGAYAEVSTILMDKVADWLTGSSLAGDDLETMVRGFCERLAAAGNADCARPSVFLHAAPAL